MNIKDDAHAKRIDQQLAALFEAGGAGTEEFDRLSAALSAYYDKVDPPSPAHQFVPYVLQQMGMSWAAADARLAPVGVRVSDIAARRAEFSDAAVAALADLLGLSEACLRRSVAEDATRLAR